MKKDFSETLKELRIRAGYTQKQVYDMLNIRQSTFSAWETGRAEPSADMLLKLCKLYNVKDIFAAFGYDGYNDDGSIRLNMYEVDLVEKYRNLDDHGKEMVNLVLDKESDRCESEYMELVARGGKYKVKKEDVVAWVKQLNLDDYEEDHELG